MSQRSAEVIPDVPRSCLVVSTTCQRGPSDVSDDSQWCPTKSCRLQLKSDDSSWSAWPVLTTCQGSGLLILGPPNIKTSSGMVQNEIGKQLCLLLLLFWTQRWHWDKLKNCVLCEFQFVGTCKNPSRSFQKSSRCCDKQPSLSIKVPLEVQNNLQSNLRICIHSDVGFGGGKSLFSISHNFLP